MTTPINNEVIPGKIERAENGAWRCAHCEFTSENWYSVLGHQSKHFRKRNTGNPYGIKGKVRLKDPLEMTFGELIETLDILRTNLDSAEKRARDAERNLGKLREIFGAIMDIE